MRKAIENFSVSPESKRYDLGNIILPLEWEIVHFNLAATWNSGIWFNKDEGKKEECKVAYIPNGNYVRNLPTSAFEIAGLEVLQVRLHEDEGHWGIAQYLSIVKQADLEKVGISRILYDLKTARRPEYRLVALPSLKFGVVDLTELLFGEFETKLWGRAELNANGFFLGGGPYKRPEVLLKTTKKPISIEEPFVAVISQQNGIGQELQHLFVAFASKLTK